jgi:glutaredoxin
MVPIHKIPNREILAFAFDRLQTFLLAQLRTFPNARISQLLQELRVSVPVLAIHSTRRQIEVASMTESRRAILYRMVLPNHACPYGVRAKEMLEEAGYQVEDRVLRSRREVDAFLDEKGFATTPQVFIGENKIGGSDELELYLIKQHSVA